eukprot:TRINITY_DN1998_c0_g1_i1.p1 TRINITY_DN1998_c0_g1~~TRINITY_DN1998_c0_g1_i1.p1  ORF type:complete len:1450 (+),score=311.27 TRINITY_DN1998_c0_g1_i1:500-4849(+)
MKNAMGSEDAGGTSDSPPDPDDEALEFVEVDPTGRYGRYDVVLGKGAFKTVYRAFDEVDGIEVAWNQVKVQDVLQSPEDLERLYTEVDLLKTLKHKNIIKFYNSWVDTKTKNVNFITEIFTSGNLRQYRKRHKHVDLKAVKNWSRQILRGLLYLHSHDPPIIHRDLKCDNIFVNGNQGEVKIGDLGLAAILRQAHAAHSVIGTPEFMAPELYEEEYNELVDIYSFGMCLLEMVTFEYPYSECTNAAQIYKKVTSGKKPAALDKVKDPDVRAFVERCLAPVAKRLPARELLNDPFLQSDTEKESTESLSRSESRGDMADDELPAIPEEPLSFKGDGGGDSSGRGRRATGESLNGSNTGDQSFTMPIAGELEVDGSSQNGLVGQQQDTAGASLDGQRRSRDFRVKGKRRDDDTIYLRLRIVDSEGHVRNIHFPFDVEIDTALSVASEMVAELDLSDQDVTTISEMIDDEIQLLVPEWKPGVAVEEGSTINGASEADDYVEPLDSGSTGERGRSHEYEPATAGSHSSHVESLPPHRNRSESPGKFIASPSRAEGSTGTIHGRFEEVTYARGDPKGVELSSDESDENMTNTYMARKSPLRERNLRFTAVEDSVEGFSTGRASPNHVSPGHASPTERVSPSGRSSVSHQQTEERLSQRSPPASRSPSRSYVSGQRDPNDADEGRRRPTSQGGASSSSHGMGNQQGTSLNAYLEAERNMRRGPYTHESWKDLTSVHPSWDEGGLEGSERRGNMDRGGAPKGSYQGERKSSVDNSEGQLRDLEQQGHLRSGAQTPPSNPHSPHTQGGSPHRHQSKSPPLPEGRSPRPGGRSHDVSVANPWEGFRSELPPEPGADVDEGSDNEEDEEVVRREIEQIASFQEKEMRDLQRKHEQVLEQARLEIKNKLRRDRKGGDQFDSQINSPDRRSFLSSSQRFDPELFRDVRDVRDPPRVSSLNGLSDRMILPRPTSGPALYDERREYDDSDSAKASLREIAAKLKLSGGEMYNGPNRSIMEDRGSGRATPQPCGSGYSSLDEGPAARPRRDSDVETGLGKGPRRDEGVSDSLQGRGRGDPSTGLGVEDVPLQIRTSSPASSRLRDLVDPGHGQRRESVADQVMEGGFVPGPPMPVAVRREASAVLDQQSYGGGSASGSLQGTPRLAASPRPEASNTRPTGSSSAALNRWDRGEAQSEPVLRREMTLESGLGDGRDGDDPARQHFRSDAYGGRLEGGGGRRDLDYEMSTAQYVQSRPEGASGFSRLRETESRGCRDVMAESSGSGRDGFHDASGKGREVIANNESSQARKGGDGSTTRREAEGISGKSRLDSGVIENVEVAESTGRREGEGGLGVRRDSSTEFGARRDWPEASHHGKREETTAAPSRRDAEVGIGRNDGGVRGQEQGLQSQLKKQQLEKSIAELEAKHLEGLHSKNGFSLSGAKKHPGVPSQASSSRPTQPSDKA